MIHFQPLDHLTLNAKIDDQGVLTAQLPDSLRGQSVTVIVQLTPPHPQETLLDVFAQADRLTFPRRQHTEILDELHTLRGNT